MRKPLIPKIVAVLIGAGLAFGLGLTPVVSTEPAQAAVASTTCYPKVSASKWGSVLSAVVDNRACYTGRTTRVQCSLSTGVNIGEAYTFWVFTAPRQVVTKTVVKAPFVATVKKYSCRFMG